MDRFGRFAAISCRKKTWLKSIDETARSDKIIDEGPKIDRVWPYVAFFSRRRALKFPFSFM